MGTLQQAVCVEPTNATAINNLRRNAISEQKFKTEAKRDVLKIISTYCTPTYSQLYVSWSSTLRYICDIPNTRAQRGRRDTEPRSILVTGAGTELIEARLNITDLPGEFYENLTNILSGYQWHTDMEPIMTVIDEVQDLLLALLPNSIASAANTERAHTTIQVLRDKGLLQVPCGSSWGPTGRQLRSECRQKEALINDYLNTGLDSITSKGLTIRVKRQVRPDQFAGAKHYGPQYEPPPIACHLACSRVPPSRHPLYTIAWRTCLSSNGVPVKMVLYLVAEYNMWRDYQHRIHWLPQHLGTLPHDHVPDEFRAILQNHHFNFLYNDEESHL